MEGEFWQLPLQRTTAIFGSKAAAVRLEGGGGQSEDGGHLAHVGAGAGQSVDVAFFGGLLHAGLGQGTTAREAAAAAVGAGQTSLRFVNQRVLLDLELLCHEVQNHGQ